MREEGIGPVIRSVTIATGEWDARGVDVVLKMAGNTLALRSLQRGDILCTGMAAAACQWIVPTDEREGGAVVVEGTSIRINPIMTAQAGFVEVGDMLNHVIGIISSMTGTACLQVK